MGYYFSKHFSEFNLDTVTYVKCPECGFCCSETHYGMSEEKWKILNKDFHEIHNDGSSKYNSNRRWFNQALMLHLLKMHGIIKGGKWIDYASGEGILSSMLEQNFNIKLSSFDKYVKPLFNGINETELNDKYNVVVNGAYFEHVRKIGHLDLIDSLVKESGVMAIHTLVRESIPKDPAWFYLVPVHTSFYTNESMGKLMARWGYTCSIYSEESQMWVMFKSSPKIISQKVSDVNAHLGWEYLHFKNGFMDYWK